MAGTVQFNGTISSIETPNSLFNIGDEVVVSYTLLDSPYAEFPVNPTGSVFAYLATSGYVSVGNNTYEFSQQASYLTEYNVFGQYYGPSFSGSVDTTAITVVDVTLLSLNPAVVTPDGMLINGFLPWGSYFTYGYGRLRDINGGISYWDMTSYSVTGFSSANVPEPIPTPAVPDSTSTVWVLALAIIGLICLRHRLIPTEVACPV